MQTIRVRQAARFQGVFHRLWHFRRTAFIREVMMRRTTYALAITVAAAIAPALAPAQIVDSSGQESQMIPGSEKGAAKDAPAGTALAAKTVYVPPSEDEQLSRALLELRSQRVEAATKYGAGDAPLRDLDIRIRTLQQQIASRSAVFVDAGPESGTAPVYPRIVQSYAMPSGYSGGNTPSGGAAEAGAPVHAPAAGGGPDDSPENLALRRALAGATVTLQADALGLEKCLKVLGEQAHVNMFVNWQALATVNVERNTPVTLNVVEVNAEKALKVILAQAGGANATLGYTADEGVLTVSTKEDLSSAKYQVVKVFDVRDLLATDSGAFPPFMAMQLYSARAGGLMDTIKSVVAPDTWRESGGTIGSIRELNGQLIISQTADNQKAIAELLAKLRGR
jgi:hypothetical protein